MQRLQMLLLLLLLLPARATWARKLPRSVPATTLLLLLLLPVRLAILLLAAHHLHYLPHSCK
jgi:hypothetical protein